MHFKALTALALVLAAAPAAAQDKADDKKDAPVEKVEPQVRTTRMSGVFGGQRIRYNATIGETIIKAEDGTPKAAIVTTAYVREPRDPQPAGDLPVQRRPGLGLGVAADGRVRAEAGGDPVRRARRRRPALSAARQSRQHPRRHRPGVHRPAGHRLLAPDRQDRAEGILRRHRRRQGGRRGHPPLAQRQRPLEQPQISRRRELWHDPHRRGGQRAGRLDLQRRRAQRRCC